MRKEDWTREMYEHLTKKIIPYWVALRDDREGGYYGYVGYDLKVDRQAVKGCILNSRILWFFSNAAVLFDELSQRDDTEAKGLGTKDENLMLAAQMEYEAVHAYEFLRDRCVDRQYGGVLWAMNADGTVADPVKHTYNQAFAIYALSSYYDMCGNPQALDLAFSLAEVVETKCTDEHGYLEAFNRDFTPAENDKLSENGVMAEKTMNTLLHVLEAYTELLRVCKKHGVTGRSVDRIKSRLEFILDTVAGKIYNPELHRQEVFFDREYRPIIDLHSYGHDIEASWLTDRALSVLDEAEYDRKLAPITLDLAQEILRRAYVDHSLLNECERGVDNPARIWWVQAETVVGFHNAYEKLPNAKCFLEASEDVWGFIREKIADHREGSEWFWEVDAAGVPNREHAITDPWKCPYHNGRMCMEMIRRNL